MARFDQDGIPKAFRWESFFCGSCPNVHLIFFDDTGVPIAHATMSAAHARGLAKSIDARDPNFRLIEGGHDDDG